MNLVDRLIAIGYSREQAEKLVAQYQANHDLDKLETYIEVRETVSGRDI